MPVVRQHGLPVARVQAEHDLRLGTCIGSGTRSLGRVQKAAKVRGGPRSKVAQLQTGCHLSGLRLQHCFNRIGTNCLRQRTRHGLSTSVDRHPCSHLWGAHGA